jgi:hypothetical protein
VQQPEPRPELTAAIYDSLIAFNKTNHWPELRLAQIRQHLAEHLAADLASAPAAVSAGPAPATDRAAERRDRYAAPLFTLMRQNGWDGERTEPVVREMDLVLDAVLAVADAEQAVLPASRGRATALREAADHIETLTGQAYEHALSDHEIGRANGLETAMRELRRMADEPPQQQSRQWCKCRSCWGWFVEDHPGEDLDELGRDLSWWSGLPEHRDAPAVVAQPDEEA